MRKVVASVVVAVVLAACSKKSEPPTPASFTTACVLSDESGNVVQCFEQSDTQPRSTRKSHCDDYEAAKRELRDGTCPSGLGVCDTHDGHKSPCYRDRDDCEDRCKKSGGVFSPG